MVHQMAMKYWNPPSNINDLNLESLITVAVAAIAQSYKPHDVNHISIWTFPIIFVVFIFTKIKLPIVITTNSIGTFLRMIPSLHWLVIEFGGVHIVTLCNRIIIGRMILTIWYIRYTWSLNDWFITLIKHQFLHWNESIIRICSLIGHETNYKSISID